MGGVALAAYGATTFGLGLANLINSFQDEPKEIPGSLPEAVGSAYDRGQGEEGERAKTGSTIGGAVNIFIDVATASEYRDFAVWGSDFYWFVKPHLFPDAEIPQKTSEQPTSTPTSSPIPTPTPTPTPKPAPKPVPFIIHWPNNNHP